MRMTICELIESEGVGHSDLDVTISDEEICIQDESGNNIIMCMSSFCKLQHLVGVRELAAARIEREA